MAEKIMNGLFNLGGNGRSTVAEGYDSKSRSIVKLGEAKEQRLYGFIIGKEGKTAKGKILPRKVLLCGEEALISLPERYTKIFEEYGDEQIAALNSGRMFIKNIRELETTNGSTFIFDIVTDD